MSFLVDYEESLINVRSEMNHIDEQIKKFKCLGYSPARIARGLNLPLNQELVKKILEIGK